MDIGTFKNSLTGNEVPMLSPVYLQALWYEAKGDWEKAHGLIQDIDDQNAAWIHAYLHRKEGDIGNAEYWYRRANKMRPSVTLKEEWENLVNAFCEK
jgi:hypothetical protein